MMEENNQQLPAPGYPVTCEDETQENGSGDGKGSPELGRLPSYEPAQRLQLDGNPDDYGDVLNSSSDRKEPLNSDLVQPVDVENHQPPSVTPQMSASIPRSDLVCNPQSPDEFDRGIANPGSKVGLQGTCVPVAPASPESAILNVGGDDLVPDPSQYEELGIRPGVFPNKAHDILPSGSARAHLRDTSEVRYGSEEDLARMAETFSTDAAGSHTMIGVVLWQKQRQLSITNGRYENYEVLGKLGRGQQGQCVKARDLESGFELCIKTITNPKEYRSEEIKFLLHLSEVDGMVKVFGATKCNGTVHILLELLDGKNLADWITRRRAERRVDREEIRTLMDIFEKVLKLLLQLKDKKIIHDDIKALNIMLIEKTDQELTPCLVDFGAARWAPVPMMEVLRGTITHCSPEKVRSEGHSFPAEVYAATTILLHMLEGTVPLSELEIKEKIILRVGMNGPPDVPLWIAPPVRQIIQAGWHMDPEQRDTAEELLDRVNQFQTGDLDDTGVFSEESVLDRSNSSRSSEDVTMTPTTPTTLGVRVQQTGAILEDGEYDEDDDMDSDDEDEDEEEDEDGDTDESDDDGVDDDDGVEILDEEGDEIHDDDEGAMSVDDEERSDDQESGANIAHRLIADDNQNDICDTVPMQFLELH